METQNIRLEKSLHKWLKMEAARQDKSILELLNEIVNDYKEFSNEENNNENR